MSRLTQLTTMMFLLFAQSLFAGEWKELKDLKSYVKTSNVAKGRELVNKCLNDTLINRDPQLYVLATAIETKANDAENMKLYLHQKYDTAAFFNSICKIFEYTLKQEDLLKAEGAKSFAKTKKKNHEMLRLYYPNLYSGGMFFVKNKNWESAHNLFSMYIDVSCSEDFKDDRYITKARLPRAAFWSMASCFEAKKYNEVFKYRSIAEGDSANYDYALQYESMAYSELCDTVNYIKSLKRGLNRSSYSDYFYSRLTDLFNNTRRYREALALNDSLLLLQPDNKLYLYGQIVVLFNLKLYDKCLELTERLEKLDSKNMQVAYYSGLCWYNKAMAYESTLSPNPTSTEYKTRKKEVDELYQRAMPYLEKYKEAFPDNKDKWQAPLYKIYFNLNLGEKLKELEK